MTTMESTEDIRNLDDKVAISQTDKRYLKVKRLFGVLLGIPAFLFLFPFGVIISIIIFLDDPYGGSPIFFQNRIGKDMKKFKCVKFRTMKEDAPHNQATNSFVGAEYHITRVGKFLRKTSLDELPQLWNIIKGDMALVGPRPLILSETDVHEKRRIQGIYSIKPGLTGLAQIRGRDFVNNDKKVDLDYQYWQNMSLSLDLKIILGTIGKVIKMEGIVDSTKHIDTLSQPYQKTTNLPSNSDKNK